MLSRGINTKNTHISIIEGRKNIEFFITTTETIF